MCNDPSTTNTITNTITATTSTTTTTTTTTKYNKDDDNANEKGHVTTNSESVCSLLPFFMIGLLKFLFLLFCLSLKALLSENLHSDFLVMALFVFVFVLTF